MFLRLQIRPNQPETAPLGGIPGYRIHPSSFGASLGLHLLLVTIILFNPIPQSWQQATIYHDIIQPQEHKIIYYDFRQKLPEVRPARKIGRGPKPQGAELSPHTMIAASRQAKSERQFIWRPVPKIELPRDLALPNLIARTTTALPPPPAEVPKKAEPPAVHKAFVPPALKTQNHPSAQPVMTDAPPETALRSRLARPERLAALNLRKTFLPPPPEAGRARSSTLTPADAPAVGGSASAPRGVRSEIPEGLGSTELPAAPPPPNVPLGPGGTGHGNADIAIASLDPAGKLNGPLPDGVRSGRFSKAPSLGEPSSGEGNGAGALTVPDLMIHEEKAPPAQVASLNRKAVLYAETVRSIPISTLSVPLRPSSRTIPTDIDARFQGRSVYTMVVPIENLPAYGGDWIVWFAEKNPMPGDTPSMHAPLPFRKLEPVRPTPAGSDRIEQRVQVSAVIKHDGTVDRVSLLKHLPPEVEKFVIQDLQSWEFKPAMRSGTPVDVDVVVEIPFNLSVEMARARAK